MLNDRVSNLPCIDSIGGISCTLALMKPEVTAGSLSVGPCKRCVLAASGLVSMHMGNGCVVCEPIEGGEFYQKSYSDQIQFREKVKSFVQLSPV